MNVALDELFTRLGFDRQKVWRLSVAFWTLFTASCVLAVYLSSWGKGAFITLGLYLYMMFVALPILFAPAFWLIAGGLFAFIGQFGGKIGPSFDDAIAAVKEYGTAILGKGAYVMLLALPIWFIAMRLIDTKGIEEWFLFAFPLLPTTIYLVVKRWPDGKTFEAVVRTTLLAIVLGIVALGVYNTLERKVTDPAVVEMQAYEKKLLQEKKSEEAILARDLRKKVEAKEPLSAKEMQAWNTLRRLAKEQSIQGRAGKLTAEVLDGKAADPSWWREHWMAILIATVALIIAYRFFFVTPQAVTAGSADNGHTVTTHKGRRLWPWIFLGVIAWSWYSIDQEVGFPGAWVAHKSYKHIHPVTIADLGPQQPLCGMPPNTKMKSLIGRDAILELQRRDPEGGFYYRHEGTAVATHYSVKILLVGGSVLGPNSTFRSDDRGCTSLDFRIEPKYRSGTMLGPPYWEDGKLTYSKTGQPFNAEILIESN